MNYIRTQQKIFLNLQNLFKAPVALCYMALVIGSQVYARSPLAKSLDDSDIREAKIFSNRRMRLAFNGQLVKHYSSGTSSIDVLMDFSSADSPVMAASL